MATYKGKYSAAVFLPCDITLVSSAYTLDSIGQPVTTEGGSVVHGMIGSVSASEDERAGQKGFKAAHEAVVWAFEYNDEEVAIVNGKRYQIYRYYRRSDGRVELYLGQRAGVNR